MTGEPHAPSRRGYAPLPRRQASLQYFTCSQSRAHFLRQVKGRPHVAQIFVGKCCFFTPRISRETRGPRRMSHRAGLRSGGPST